MSAQEFKPGDRVRCVKSSAAGSTPAVTAGDEYTVAYIDGDYVAVDGQQGCWWSADRFEKVEPEFVVGQQVSDCDYARLPVGSKATDSAGTIVKAAPRGWRYDRPGEVTYPNSDWSDERTLTHLGDGTHSGTDSLTDSDTVTEPEDKDDLYVEPEPLKEGTPVLLWVKVEEIHDDGDVMALATHFDGEEQYFTVTPDAIVRPDAERSVEREAIAAITKTLRAEGGMDYDAAHKTAASLYRAGVRITEGGAS